MIQAEQYLYVGRFTMFQPRSNSLDDDSGSSGGGVETTAFRVVKLLPINSEQHGNFRAVSGKYATGSQRRDSDYASRGLGCPSLDMSENGATYSSVQVELPTRKPLSSWCRARKAMDVRRSKSTSRKNCKTSL